MKSKFTAILLALIAAVFIMVEPVAVCAEDDDKESLSEIRAEIEEQEEKLEEGKAEVESLSSQVTELEQKINNLEVAIDEGEKKLDILIVEVDEAQKKVDEQTENLNGRLRNMYKNSSVGFLDVLLGSNSFSEFLTNLDIVKIIYSADQDVLKDLEEAHDELERKKQEVESLQYELKASKETTVAQKTNVQEKKAEIAKSNEETEKMIDDLQAEADAMIAKIQSAGSSSTTSVYTGGELMWPTPTASYITSPFGYRIHPIYGYRKFHTGIDIGAGSGSSIVSANDGVVILSGWNGGYGKCIVVDHGGGITTLYAHCSSLLVGNGQTVTRGQNIALVGSTGASTGPHLHFEVRLNGEYKNPLSYVQ